MRIGIDLGGTKIAVILLDAEDGVVFEHQRATPQGDYKGTLKAIVDLARLAQEHAAQPCTLGLASPGSLSPVTGLMRNCNSTCLNGQSLVKDIQAQLKLPIRLENDANCFALSEAIDGSAQTSDVVFGVILGTGVGGGLVLEKRLLSGRNGIAGEWGHNPFPLAHTKPISRDCYCGLKDCNENWLSGPALQRSYREAGGDQLIVQHIVERAAQGEELARFVLGQYCDDLAAALVPIINTLDPDTIVLGGGVGQIGQLYVELPKRLPSLVFSDSFATAIVAPHYGAASGVRGAARLFDA